MAEFSLVQYGGANLGTAGDACLIRFAGKNIVVDFGKGKQRDWLEGGIGSNSYSAIVTHFHDDHCGTSMLRKNADRLWVNPTSVFEDHTSALEQKNCQAANNDEEIWDSDDKHLNLTLWFIEGAGIEDHAQGENAHSAGVYGRVAYKEAPVFRFLLLGDMVPEAWDNVVQVLPEGKMLDYVKLPHHGSPSNHMPDLFKNHVGTSTRMVTSGYNFIDSEWDKIKLSNNKLTLEQFFILTHHQAKAPGTKWGPYQRKWFKATVGEDGQKGWDAGAPDRSIYD